MEMVTMIMMMPMNIVKKPISKPGCMPLQDTLGGHESTIQLAAVDRLSPQHRGVSELLPFFRSMANHARRSVGQLHSLCDRRGAADRRRAKSESKSAGIDRRRAGLSSVRLLPRNDFRPREAVAGIAGRAACRTEGARLPALRRQTPAGQAVAGAGVVTARSFVDFLSWLLVTLLQLRVTGCPTGSRRI